MLVPDLENSKLLLQNNLVFVNGNLVYSEGRILESNQGVQLEFDR